MTNMIKNVKKTFYFTLLAVGLSALATGCAMPKGSLYSDMKQSGSIPVPKDKGLVFIYSHDLPLGRAFNVWANGLPVSSSMGYGKFFYFDANPGELHIASKMGSVTGGAGLLAFDLNEINRAVQGEKDRVVITIEPGQIYYVDMHNGFSREKMDLVSKEEGESAIQNCHWADSSDGNP